MLENTILHFVSTFGYGAIFCVLMFGIIGLPVPDEVLMAFAGYLVSLGRLHFFLTFLISALGSITGMSVSFLVGHRYGLPLLEKYGRKIHLPPERLEKVQHWFDKFGKFAVTIGYFIPGFRHFSAYSAGISRWSYRTFLLYAAPGAVAWVVTFVSLGFYLGQFWRVFIETLHRYLMIGVLAALAALIGWQWALQIRRKRLKAK